MGTKFLDVTETPGSGATAEQLSMLYTRYQWASGFAAHRDVLEVACGAGMGLGLLRASARTLVGGDYSDPLLGAAARHYGARIPLVQLDAHALPFRESSFDVVLLFEALYYLDRPEHFVREARRVLREPGMLLICTVNREWSGFNPSSFSRHYFSASKLRDLLQGADFEVDLLGGFPPQEAGTGNRVLGGLRRMAVRAHLVPRTMRGKERIKRLLYGRLTPIPNELEDGSTPTGKLYPLSQERHVREFKVLYAAGSIE